MHPQDAECFEWDEGNEEELAGHGISPWEVEEVFWGGPKWLPNKIGRSGDWKMVGRTEGNRALTIVVAVRETTRCLRPITGWTPTKGERRHLRNG